VLPAHCRPPTSVGLCCSPTDTYATGCNVQRCIAVKFCGGRGFTWSALYDKMLGRRRVGDLFNDKTVTGRLTSMAKKSIKGVENVYTQVRCQHLQDCSQQLL